MKLLKYLLIFLLRSLIVLAMGGYVLIHYFGEDVKNKIISELNKNITTKIDVEDVYFDPFTFIRDFPNVSLDFRNITAHSNTNFNKSQFKENTDTLFSAEKLSLHFNIKDLWEENYSITNIWAENGSIYLYTDRNNNISYQFWQDNNDESGNIDINIEDLLLKNMSIYYKDLYSEQFIDTKAARLKLSGKFGSDRYSIRTNADLFVTEYTIGKVTYVSYRNISSSTKIDVDGDLYRIDNGNLQVAGMIFDISGTIKNEEETSLDLSINGKNLDIQSFLSLLPEQYKEETKAYESEGNFFFDTRITGVASAKKSPQISTEFGIERGRIKNAGSNVELSNLTAKGSLTNGKKHSAATSVLSFEEFSASLGETMLTGKGSLTNFINPKVSFDLNSVVNLEEFNSFFPIDTLDFIKGKAKGDISFTGSLSSLSDVKSGEIIKSKLTGDFEFEDVTFGIRDDKNTYREINGKFRMRNNKAHLDSTSIVYNDTKFEFSGTLTNLINYILSNDEALVINGTLATGTLDYNKLSSNGDSQEEVSSIFPDNYNGTIELNAEKFIYENLESQNLSTSIHFNESGFAFNNFKMNTLGGNIFLDMNLVEKPDGVLGFSCNGQIGSIDINQLFKSFHNFGQEFLLAEHLKGKLNSNVNLKVDLNKQLVVIDKSIAAEIKIEVTNGELIEFEPMLELSRFIEVNELKHIKFSTLKNDLLIKDEVITIPTMEIKTSAIDISASGIHKFSGEFEYNLEVLLNDLLAKKAKAKATKEDNQFGVVEDDGLGRTKLFLLIEGNTEDFKVRYNRRMAKDKIRENLREEKNEIKKILMEEFGLFKNKKDTIAPKDTTLNSDKPKDKQKPWDKPKEEDQEKKPVRIIWDEESGTNNKESELWD